MRACDEFTEWEMAAHRSRLDRLQIRFFGFWLPLRPAVLFMATVGPGLVGWDLGGRLYGIGGSLLSAAVFVAAATLWAETATNIRVVPRILLPRRRRLERSRLERCMDRVLLRRSIAEANSGLAFTEPDSPLREAVESDLALWRKKLDEAGRDLDDLEAELAARYEDWRRFLAQGEPDPETPEERRRGR